MTSKVTHRIRLPTALSNVRCSTSNENIPCHTTDQFSEQAESPLAQLQSSQDLLAALDGIRGAVTELEGRRQASLNELQQLAIELAVAATAKLTGYVIEENQHDIVGLIRSLTSDLSPTQSAVLYLHPEDVDLVRELTNEEANKLPDSIQLRPNAQLARGSCRLDESAGQIRISEIRRRLTEIYNEWLEDLKHAQIERRNAERNARPLQRFPDRRGTA
ncbi:MAG: FliH/SctL family protein [Planctomycetaceae bacterium]